MICFSICVFNLLTGISESPSPKYFLTTRLDFDYQPSFTSIPELNSYLHMLTDGHEDRTQFLIAWFWLLIQNQTSTQTIYAW